MKNDYYKEITENESNNIIRDNMVSVSDVQRTIISKYIGIIYLDFYMSRKLLKFSTKGQKYSEYSGYIVACKDEYFIFATFCISVSIDRIDNYYLCDQFDGLIKCIKDNYGK